jgi:hypothetical protein
MMETGKTLLEDRLHRLSRALYFKDAYSGGSPTGQIDVYLKGTDKKAIKNSSSYYLFLNLPPGSYSAKVISENYFSENHDFEIKGGTPLESPAHKASEISLMPRPSYPFPSGETLVRGTLRQGEKPVSNAWISGKIADLGSRDFRALTDERGEFALFFGVLTDYNVVNAGPKFYVKGTIAGDGKSIGIKINNTIDKIISNIEVGKINSRNIDI